MNTGKAISMFYSASMGVHRVMQNMMTLGPDSINSDENCFSVFTMISPLCEVVRDLWWELPTTLRTDAKTELMGDYFPHQSMNDDNPFEDFAAVASSVADMALDIYNQWIDVKRTYDLDVI